MALTTKQRKGKIKAAWEDMLIIVETLIADAKAGEVKLTAGLLKEINTLLTNLTNQVENEESEVRPHEELKAMADALPEDLKKMPLRFS